MDEKTRSISAIWKSKKKSVEECTELVLNFLLHLKDYDYNLFGVWYEKGNSKKKALEKKVELSIGYIQSALKKNWDKKFDDLGARISYWTGNEDEDKSSSISFNVGAYGDKSFNKNSCIINLPQEYKANEKDNYPHDLIDLMKGYWKPDKILVNGEVFENKVS